MTEQEYPNSMVFYRSFIDAIEQLPPTEQLLLYRNTIYYALGNEIMEFTTPLQQLVWTLIKPQLDANIKRRKDGAKGASHGKKGGRPKNPKNPTGDNIQNPTGDNKKTPNNNANNNANNNYLSLFQSKKWFDRFKYPRDKKAMKLWLTHLHDKGNSLKPISVSSWEIQMKDILSYCAQGYYLLDAVEFAIKHNWDTMNLGKEYSKNTKREDIVRKTINKRNSLHIRLKKLAEANNPNNKPFKWENLTEEKQSEYRKRYQDASNDGHAGEMLQIAMEKAIGKDKLIGSEIVND